MGGYIEVPEEQWHPSARGHNFEAPICVKGHDKRIEGISPNRACKACRRDANRKRQREGRRPKYLRNPLCPRGHDKALLGIKDNGRCSECDREEHRKRGRESRERDFFSRIHSKPLPKLRQQRRALGISARRLAEMVGCHPSTIWSIETGHFNATPA